MWRKGPAKPTGRGLERALNRAAEIGGVGIGKLGIEAHVPRRRIVDLARHGMSARAQALRRLGGERQLATLVATVAYLEARSVDDCLELLDLLMTTELLGKAEAATDKERARRHPPLARHSARLAAAVEVLLDVTDAGGELTLGQVWESIEAVVPRPQLRESVDAVADLVPPPGLDADAETRARLAERIAVVTPFLKILPEVITFGATPEGEAALVAMRTLPRLLDRRTKITAADIDHELLSGSWKALVLPKDGGVDRSAWVFCVLTAFHRHLKRREIYAGASTRWRDPRAQLLAGEKWERAKGPALTDLQLSENPDALLAEQSRALDAALRDTAAQVSAGTVDATVDDQGRLHLPRLAAIPEPPSLIDLRKRVAAMLPRVDLPEVILEVMAWVPEFTAAFTLASGGQTRLDDLHVSVAACLTAQALNIGYAPVAKKGTPALEPARLAHVASAYLSAEAFSKANAPLIGAQAGVPFARALGGGLVAAIDGMRFVVPVPSVYARPTSSFAAGYLGGATRKPSAADIPVMVINPSCEQLLLEQDDTGGWRNATLDEFISLGLRPATGNFPPHIHQIRADLVGDRLTVTINADSPAGHTWAIAPPPRLRTTAPPRGFAISLTTKRLPTLLIPRISRAPSLTLRQWSAGWT